MIPELRTAEPRSLICVRDRACIGAPDRALGASTMTARSGIEGCLMRSLRGSRWPGAFIGLATVTGMIVAYLRRDWVAFGVFACFLAYGVWQVAAPPTLTVTGGAIVIRRNGRNETYDLAKCSEFAVHRNRFGTSNVVYDYDDGRNGWIRRWVRRSQRKRLGAPHELLENFGIGATELSDLLNRARSDALDSVGIQADK